MKKWKKMLIAGVLSLGLAIPGAVMTGCLDFGCKPPEAPAPETPTPENPAPEVTYIVSYYNADGSLMVSFSIKEGEACSMLTTPTKSSDRYYDYTFEYWVDDEGNEITTELQNVTKNINAYPHFSAIQPTFTVNFYDADNQTILKTSEIGRGEAATIAQTPTKESDRYYDYTFEYWVDEEGNEITTELQNITKNIDAYPYFSAIQPTFTVNFYDSDKTTLLKTSEVGKGKAATIAQTPTKASDAHYDYTFEYWVDDEGSEITTELQNVTKNINAYPHFSAIQPTFTVNFYDADNQTILKTSEIGRGEAATIAQTPTKESDRYYDYTFEYWVDEEGNEITTELQNVTKNINAYPYFSAYQPTLTVNFYDIDKTTLLKTYDVKKGSGVNSAFKDYQDETNYYSYNWVDKQGNIVENFDNIQNNLDLYVKDYTTIQLKVTVNGVSYEYSADTNGYMITDAEANISEVVLESEIAGVDVTRIRGAEHLGGGAFKNCTSLTSITIPKTITSIGLAIFEGCDSLTSIIVETGNPVYDSRDNCNAIIKTETNTLIAGCKSTQIPSSITIIGSYAFEGCRTLENLTIPEGVTTLDHAAFAGCIGLKNVRIPTSLISMRSNTFSRCIAITSIIIEDGNPVYDSRDNCNAIIETATNELIIGCQSTIIPVSVTSIGFEAFYNCQTLTSITIPVSVTSIGESAFSGCSSLTSIILPENVTSIGSKAFYGCESLTSIIIPKSVTSIGERVCPENDKVSIYYQGSSTDWKKIDIEEYNPGLNRAPKYYYIENEKDLPNDGGNYWHYDEDGVTPVIWGSEEAE